MNKPAWKTEKIRVGVVRYDHENYEEWKVSLEGTVSEVLDAICDWSNLKIWLERDYSQEAIDSSEQTKKSDENE